MPYKQQVGHKLPASELLRAPAGSQSYQIQRGPDYKLGLGSLHSVRLETRERLQHHMKDSLASFCRVTQACLKEPDKHFFPHSRPFQSGEEFGEVGSYLCFKIKQSRSSVANRPIHDRQPTTHASHLSPSHRPGVYTEDPNVTAP